MAVIMLKSLCINGEVSDKFPIYNGRNQVGDLTLETKYIPE